MDKIFRIIDNKGSGKTSRLMLLAKEHDGIIVCRNPYAMAEKAKAYGIVGISFISYYEFITEREVYEKVPYYIDELEDFVKFFRSELKGYTLSKED